MFLLASLAFREASWFCFYTISLFAFVLPIYLALRPGASKRIVIAISIFSILWGAPQCTEWSSGPWYQDWHGIDFRTIDTCFGVAAVTSGFLACLYRLAIKRRKA